MLSGDAYLILLIKHMKKINTQKITLCLFVWNLFTQACKVLKIEV